MTNEDETCIRVRQVIHRLVTDGKIVARSDNSEHEIFPVAVSLTEGQALRDWVVKESVARTVEIGLAYGVSALFVCEGLLINGHANAQHVVIDPFQSTGYKDCGLQLLDEAGVVDLIEYQEEESQILLPKFLSEGRRFELAFVDGSHLFERVFLDLIYLGRLIEPGGIIFVDDYQLPAIAKCVSFCLTNLSWTLEEVAQPDDLHQWVVLRTPRNSIPRSFRDFVDF
jgi:predicted O-methyltransferase YrrM